MQYSYLHYLQYNTATYTTYNTIQLLTLLGGGGWWWYNTSENLKYLNISQSGKIIIE